jgi:hypothetical protein
MRKLLLIILVPIFALAMMGCGDQVDAAVQTDEKIQGGWFFEDGDYTLYINAAAMSVKYMKDIVIPYRTEFGYTNLAAGSNRYSNADETEIKGTMTLFNYKENFEIATLELILTIDKEDSKNNILEIVTITYENEEYYYADAMPKIGEYTNMGGGEGGGGGTPKPKPPETPPTPVVVEDFTISGLMQNYPGTPFSSSNIIPKTGKSQGAISNIQYEGVAPYVYAKSAVFPALPGQYRIYFDVAKDTANNFAKAEGLVFPDDPANYLTIRGSRYTSGFDMEKRGTGSSEPAFSVANTGVVAIDNVTTSANNPFAFAYIFPGSLDPTYNRVVITIKTTSDTSTITPPLSFNFFADDGVSTPLSTTGGSASANAAAVGAETTYTFTTPTPNNRVVFRINSTSGNTLNLVVQITQVVFYQN